MSSADGARRRLAHSTPSPPGSPQRTDQVRVGSMVRSASRDVLLGPSQRQTMNKRQDPSARSFGRSAALVAAVGVGVALAIVASTSTTLSELPSIVADVALLRRGPWTAQDNVAASVAIVLGLVPLLVLDEVICSLVALDSGARWYAIHSLGNLVVAGLSLPDFVYAARKPSHLISVEYVTTT